MTREQVYQNVTTKFEEYTESRKTKFQLANYDLVRYYDFKDNADVALEKFSEGSEVLGYLLNTCLEQKVVTRGCCKGHQDKKPAYISFEYMPENMPYINNILSRIDLDEVEVRMEKKDIGEHEISFSTYQDSDSFFDGIRQIILDTQLTQDYSDSIPGDIKEMINIFNEDSLGDSSTLVLYCKKSAGKSNYTVICAEPSYLRVNNDNILSYKDKGASILFFRTASTEEGQATLNEITNNVKAVNKKRIEQGHTLPPEDESKYPVAENPELSSVLQTAIGHEITQSEGTKTRVEIATDPQNVSKRIIKVINQKIGSVPTSKVIFSFDNGYDFDNMLLPEFICRYLEKKEIKDRVYRETHIGSKGHFAAVDNNDNTLLIESLDTPVVIKAGLTVNELAQASKGKMKTKTQGPSL